MRSIQRTSPPTSALPTSSKELVAVLGSHRWRHWGPVVSVAISPDEKLIASAGSDSRASVWDPATGKELKHWLGNFVEFSPDGCLLAIQDRTAVRLLETATWQVKASFKFPNRIPFSPSYHGGSRLAFSRDGKSLATVGYSGSVRVWDVATGKERLALDKVGFPVGDLVAGCWAVALSGDGAILAVSGNSGGVKLWDVATRKELPGPSPEYCLGVALSRDGRTLAAGSADGTVRLWDVANRKELARLKGHTHPATKGLAFSSDDKTLASANNDGTVRLWDVAKREEKCLPLVHRGLACVTYAADGKTLASGGWDAAVRVWDVKTNTQSNVLKGHHSQPHLLTVTPDGRSVAVGTTGYGDGKIAVWKVAGAEEPTRWAAENYLLGLSLSPDGKTLATAGYQGVKLWDSASKLLLLPRLEGALNRNRATSVAFDRTGAWLAAERVNREGDKYPSEVRLWNIPKNKLELRIAGGEPISYSTLMTFSPDGALIAFTNGRAFQVCERQTGKQRCQVKLTTPGVFRSLSFAPDGKTLVTANTGNDGAVKFWDTLQGQLQKAYHGGHEGEGITCAVAHPDGSVYSAGYDGRIIHWTSRRVRRVLCQLPGPIHQLALTADSRYLFTANSNGTVYVLRLATAKTVPPKT